MYKLISIYIIILSQGLSLIGSRITGISLGFYIFSKTGNTFPLLLVAFFNELPGMLIGSFSGVVIDRFKRKYVLILSDTGQALGTLILLLSLFLNKFQLWHLYTVVLFQGFFAMFQQPALDASVTMLVPQEFRDKINGIRQMTYPLAGIIAPAITGVLYPFIGIKGAMIIDFGTFLIGISIISLIQIPEPQSTREGNLYNGSVLFESFSGFKYLLKHRELLIFVFYFSIINFLLNGPLEVVLPYLIKVTESESFAGSLLSLMSLGAFIGAGLVSLLKFKEKRVLAILAGYAATGIMMISFGMFRNSIGLSLSLLSLMIPLPAAGALFTSIMQLKTPPDIQGRVFSAFSQLLFLGTPLSFFLTGWLVDKVLEPSIAASHWKVLNPIFGSKPGSGIGFLISLAGLLILVLTIAVYMKPKLREIEKRLPDYEAVEKEL